MILGGHGSTLSQVIDNHHYSLMCRDMLSYAELRLRAELSRHCGIINRKHARNPVRVDIDQSEIPCAC
jgi:hypothetical protein